jgi:hypothetical protein
MNRIKKIVVLLLVVLVVAQFFGPDKNEGDIASVEAFFVDTNPPETVKLILKESCFDCHSSVTKYPWYNNITPVNYWIADHIKDASKHFNFSKWEGTAIKRKDHKFEELIEMIEEKEMPLASYTWMHTEAKLTDTQRESVIAWAKQVRFKYSLLPKPE